MSKIEKKECIDCGGFFNKLELTKRDNVIYDPTFDTNLEKYKGQNLLYYKYKTHEFLYTCKNVKNLDK